MPNELITGRGLLERLYDDLLSDDPGESLRMTVTGACQHIKAAAREERQAAKPDATRPAWATPQAPKDEGPPPIEAQGERVEE